eukprot:PITA_05264
MKVYGLNIFDEKPPRGFLVFVWEASQDLTLIILAVCAVVSLGVGISTEGWPKGSFEGLSILISIFIVVLVTAVSDYRKSLQFRDLDKEKKKIFVQVTRNGRRQKVCMYDLVVGDIVNLSIGDLVPADGIFISGYSLLINESSLTGESEPVSVGRDKPFLLSGTKVQDGSGKMLVTTVGMRTGWGKLLATFTKGGEDETLLQVKLNGVASLIGKIGLTFVVVTFIFLTLRMIVEKVISHQSWSGADALRIVNFFFFATAVTIIVVAIPEGLPLAMKFSLAFAMKNMMNDKELVRHLSACETMGSTICICSDKTGTLTTNRMVVVKVWITNNVKKIGSVKEERNESRIIKVEPFNSVRKRMTVVVMLPDGKYRVYCKGASKIILKMCNKGLDGSGSVVALDEVASSDLNNIINGFVGESLRTLCLAYIDLEDYFDPERQTFPTNGYTCICIVGIKDLLRPGVKEAVELCRTEGITVRMVTGGNINTAKAIAAECGILTDDGVAIEGPDFRKPTSLSVK